MFVALAITLDSPGPIFYRQERVGKAGRIFQIAKLRTMIPDAERLSGPTWAQEDDPRITRVGRVLRRWSIDELPQLFNVLCGQMSLVGPRPPLPEEVEEYTEKHMKRLQTIPGITGVWQISGRSSLGFEEMVKLDLYYVDNWSVWMDFAILLITPLAIVSRKGAY